jgi:5'-nucleotidase
LGKNDGELESTIGNMMADMMLLQTQPLFKKRYHREIDFCLLNHGGIRADIAKGNITLRTAYQVMPFENTITVAELNGERIKEMLVYLAQSKRAHPIAGLTIKLDANYQLLDAKINGKPIDYSKTYLVATSNYLMSLGDNMNFFADPVNRYDLDYKIRNAMVDYFKKIDTLEAKLDNRFIKL